MIELIQICVPLLRKGLGMALTLAAKSVAVGFNLGLARMRMSDNRALSGFARVYSITFRGTSLLVRLFLIYYGLGLVKFVLDVPALWWVVREGSRCAVLALALNTGACTSEILRGGLTALPVGLIEAAKACGMSRFTRFRRIAFPLRSDKRCPATATNWSLWCKAPALPLPSPFWKSPVTPSA